MKIRRLDLFQLAIPLKNPVVTAQLGLVTSSNILLRAEFDNGLTGYGESIPKAYVTGESTRTVFETISRRLAPAISGVDFTRLEDIEAVVVDLNRHLEGADGVFHGSALCTVELALLDGLGKLLNKPLHHILGTPIRDKIEYSLGLTYVSAAHMPAYLQIINQYQPRHFKIKMGRSLTEDLERVAAIRAYYGDRVELRVDANCQWDFETALEMAGRLEKLGVVAIEQPLPKDDIAGAARLKKLTPLKIIADESVCSFNDVKRLLDEDACDLVCIKISKCGGLLNSLKIADYLSGAGKSYILGAHGVETGILESAGRIFGALARDTRYFEGSVSSIFFAEPVVEGMAEFDRRCLASPGTAPGLGIAIKSEVLNKLVVDKVEIKLNP